MNTVLDSLQITLEPYDSARLANLCGQCNEHIRLVEHHFPIQIFNRGNLFELKGESDALSSVTEILESLYLETDGQQFISQQSVHLKIREVKRRQYGAANASTTRPQASSRQIRKKKPHYLSRLGATPIKTGQLARGAQLCKAGADGLQIIPTYCKEIKLRGENQSQYVRNIETFDINFGIGPAGTGKTYLAVASAVRALEQDLVQRIILVRPAVEAGEKLGFLPGDLAEKVNPYLRPLYDALYEMLGSVRVEKLMERGLIEVAPLAYMRGRTLNNAFIILDESQNTTTAQMKMFLTRIGFQSKAVIAGDTTQIDLPNGTESGLTQAIKMLKEVPGIGLARFEPKDVVRHPLVQRIIEAYDANA